MYVRIVVNESLHAVAEFENEETVLGISQCLENLLVDIWFGAIGGACRGWDRALVPEHGAWLCGFTWNNGDYRCGCDELVDENVGRGARCVVGAIRSEEGR
jgi:hypothetical protein